MSTKGPSQQARRTPLSLSGGSKQHLQQQQQQQQQQTQSNKPSGTNSPNPSNNSQKNEKSVNQKPEPVVIEIKDSPPLKESKRAQQKQQQQQQQQNNIETTKKADKPDEKKTQNGVGKATNGASKDKHQNGNQENGNNGAAENVKDNNKNDKSNKEEKKEKDDNAGAATINEKRHEKDAEKKPEKEGGLRTRRSDATQPESASDKKKLGKVENMDTNSNNSNKEDNKIADVSKPSTPPQSKTVTPTKAAEKTSIVVTPTKAEKSNSSRTKTITTIIDDVEMMEPLAVEASPLKEQNTNAPATLAPTAAIIAPPPIASSTPGRSAAAGKRAAAVKVDNQITKPNNNPSATMGTRSYSQISGRRSIRPLSEYTPSKFENNIQFRESYRRINTELDVTSTTNTSLNVTVGSEIANSSSFSFFGRSRKRERTPPNTQSTMELQTDVEYSPPKRARLEGFFSVVASPLTLLRSRFSKTSIQSSTPMKIRSKLAKDDGGEVQNVSGISNEATEDVTVDITEDLTVGKDVEEVAGVIKDDIAMKGDEKGGQDKLQISGENMEHVDGEIKVLEAPTVDAGIADTSASIKNNKRCNIM